jgi:hypothetical protein
MKTTKFNVSALEKWIELNAPQAVEKLCVKTELSMSAIAKIRKEAHVPRPYNLRSIAAALGVPAESLVIEVNNPTRKRA